MAAPNTYKVVKLLKSEQWKNDSPNVTHEILVEGSDRVWKAHQIKEKNHPAPVEGQELQGWMNEDKGTIGLAAPRGSQGGSGRTGGGGSAEDFDRRPDHPLVMQQRLHTSCLSSVPGFIEQMLTIGIVNQPETAENYWLLVERTAARLRQTYPEAVLARADGKPTQTSMDNGGDPKEPEPAAAAPLADDDVPF